MVPIRNPLCSSLIRSASDCVLSDKETEKESMEQVLALGRNLWHQETVLSNFKCGSAGRAVHHWQLVVLLVSYVDVVGDADGVVWW